MRPEDSKDRREAEWQMAAADLGPVRRWLNGHAALDGLVIEPRSSRELRDTYLDTDDWRIFRAGYALRTRADAGRSEATLKALHCTREDAADRREITEPLASADPGALMRTGGPVASRIEAVAAGHSLHALFEVRTLRQRFAVRNAAESQELGQIALDESVILRGAGEPTASLQRVEVEALGERHRPLERIVRLLQAECALEPAPHGKFELGLRSVGLAPATAPELAPLEADESMRASELALARLRALLIGWFTHEPAARLGDAPGHLHDLRTTVRRIDATLGLFAEYLPAALVRSRGQVKKLVRTFGAVRDLDVQMDELARFSGSLTEADRSALEPLERYLASRRGKARSRMLEVLDAKATHKWLDDSMSTLAQPSAARPARRDALAVLAAPELIERRFRKLRKAYRKLTPESSMQEYHAVRGQVKKLRYALESVGEIYGKTAAQMRRRLQRLQTGLGAQQDADLAQRLLLGLASDPPKDLSPRTLFLMGRFAEQRCAAGADARGQIRKAWRKVRGRWKALRARLEELRDRPAANGELAARAPANEQIAPQDSQAHTPAVDDAPNPQSMRA